MESNNHSEATLKQFDDLMQAVERPSERVVASFKCSPGFSLETLDAALLRHFQLDVGCEPLACVIESTEIGGVELEVIRRSMALCLELMQAGGFPIFDMPLVNCVNAGDSDGLKRFEIQMQWVYGATSAMYQSAVSGALKISLALGAECAPDFPQKAQEWLNGNVVLPIRQALRFSPSTLPILREVHRCGIPYEHLGRGVFRLGWGSNGRLHYRSASSGDAALSIQLVQNKEVTANVLRKAGLPSPEHIRVATVTEAQDAAKRLGYPVVVKPLDRDRGEGVTVDIYDSAELERAFSAAATMVKGQPLLVERQIPGICYRLFIVQGELLYAVERLPVGVTGDGVQTVSELIADAVASRDALPPWKHKPGPVLDTGVANFLEKCDISLSDVPENGSVVALRRIESMALGGMPIDVTEQVHPHNIEIAVLAARVLGLDVAGVDLMTEDISVPWNQSGAVINEVNFAPTIGTGPASAPYLKGYVKRLVPGDGKIPVELCSSSTDAVKKLDIERMRGNNWVFLTPTQVMRSDSSVINVPLSSMAGRLRALLSRDSIDGVLVSLS